MLLVYINSVSNVYSSSDTNSLLSKDPSIYEILEDEQDIVLDSQLVEDMFDELSVRSYFIAVPKNEDITNGIYGQSDLVVNPNDFRLLELVAKHHPYKIRIITQLILGSKDPLRNYIQHSQDIKDLVRQNKGAINKLSYLHSILYSSYYDTYIEALVKHNPQLSKIKSSDLSLDKIIIVASLHATYTVQKKLNYDESIEEFYNLYQNEIRSFLKKDLFSKKDFIDLIHIANLLYPFSFYNLNSKLLLTWDGVISFQRKWGLDYDSFLKLESKIGFKLENLKLFDPIFFATSLLKIVNDPYITLKHKKQCINIAKQILDKDDVYEKIKEGRLNIYIALAAADILGQYGILFENLEKDNLELSNALKILFAKTNNSLFSPEFSMLERIKTTTPNTNVQKAHHINFSINGLFLRAVACGAHKMISYIAFLHRTERLKLSQDIINEAINTAIIFGQTNVLKILLRLDIPIINFDELIMNANKNLQYETLSFLVKKHPLFDDQHKNDLIEELNRKIEHKTEERFNIFRNYSEIFSCVQLFSTSTQI